MKENTPRYIIDEISKEHFIDEHYFIYVCKGIVTLYDGIEYMELHAEECCIARKNRLGRYYKKKVDGELEKVILSLDEPFLKKFQEKHATEATKFTAGQTCIQIKQNELLPAYIQSLTPYYNHGKITAAFVDVKREELLIMLLQRQPELAGLFFDFGAPQKNKHRSIHESKL